MAVGVIVAIRLPGDPIAVPVIIASSRGAVGHANVPHAALIVIAIRVCSSRRNTVNRGLVI